MNAAELERANAEFWSSLCGSWLARQCGATGRDPDSLRRYDRAYLDFYPYLLDYVRPGELRDRDVLEVGLGYGTLGQAIAEHGARYLGMDISPVPVEMMRYRLEAFGLPGEASQRDFLDNGLPDQSFDALVSIGALHHTGSLEHCLAEAYRLLRPGGRACLMVYNAFSYRHWATAPLRTLAAAIRERLAVRKPVFNDRLRKFYDADADDNAAPFTEFNSIRRMEALLANFSSVQCRLENCADFKLLGVKFANRTTMLPILGRLLGTDIYINAVK